MSSVGTEADPVQHPFQGGPAATKSLNIESFNVIARRKALHRVWKENFVPLIASIFVKFPDVRGFGNDDLVAMQCENHTELEEVVKYLLSRGLTMTRDGAFADFAIAHGTHGVALPCAWLEYQNEGDTATVSLRPERDFLAFDWSDTGYEGPGWLAARGKGFIVSQEDDYDVWVDFSTGGTVVSLRRPTPLLVAHTAEQRAT